MSYKLEWIPSPNFTPGSQTRAIYGRPRTVEFGAGHWWGDPNAGYSHQGVVNTFLNPARQAAAHAVVSAGRVTEMVRQSDTAWCTNNANPYTYAIEFKPNYSDADLQTLCEYIADKGLHLLPWKPHKYWFSTACNPIDWDGVRQRAINIANAKNQPAPPAPAPEWKRNLGQIPDVKLYAKRDGAPLRNLNNVHEVIKTYPLNTPFEIKGRTIVNGNAYLLTKYSFDNGQAAGFDEYELTNAPYVPDPPKPEWVRNIKDIEPVKLMVLPTQTQIYHLETLQAIKPLGQGTWIDFTKMTTVAGKEYLISSYSATQALPNGILRSEVGLPATQPEPPVEDKPEWLKNWRDIADETMYARVDAPLVNLLNGATIKTIPRGTAVEIASATEWHGQSYLITKYSTDKIQAAGIMLSDLDKKPVDTTNPAPVEPAPEQPSIGDRLSWLERAVKAILDKLGIKL